MLRKSALRCAVPMRRSLRRRSMTALLEAEPDTYSVGTSMSLASSTVADGHHTASTSLTATAPESGNNSAAPSVAASHFAAKFQNHRARFEADYGGSTAVLHAKGSAVTTARHELEHVHNARRLLFAQHTPVVRLPKDKALLRQERAAAASAAALKHDDESVPRPVDPYVDVPLLPAAFIRQHALRSAGIVPRSDDGHDEAARLQLAATRNHLVQTGASQLFRCLRCFHVFSAKPSTIFKEKVQQTRLELEHQHRDKERAAYIARRPSRRKRVSSVARQRDAHSRDPGACPSCRSTLVQWAMEYVHHRTHHRPPPA